MYKILLRFFEYIILLRAFSCEELLSIVKSSEKYQILTVLSVDAVANFF